MSTEELMRKGWLCLVMHSLWRKDGLVLTVST